MEISKEFKGLCFMRFRDGISGLCRELGISRVAFYDRIKKGTLGVLRDRIAKALGVPAEELKRFF